MKMQTLALAGIMLLGASEREPIGALIQPL